MKKNEVGYAASTGAVSGTMRLLCGEPVKIGGRVFFPGQEYLADDPLVLANRRQFAPCETKGSRPSGKVAAKAEEPSDES